MTAKKLVTNLWKSVSVVVTSFLNMNVKLVIDDRYVMLRHLFDLTFFDEDDI